MTLFYIKTDLDVAGPFTGIEIREASLAGIIRPQTYLSGSADGPWVAAEHAGLFSETGVALPHPPGTAVPMFQTRGMPGAFMGPFKLRELIGFACQGMLPPGTELQSDPSRPWIPITGTGILPACLRGDLVRIEENGRLCLRTVIPADLEQRRQQLETLQSPIDRAKQIKASGATAAPSHSKAVVRTDQDAAVVPPPITSPSIAASPTPSRSDATTDAVASAVPVWNRSLGGLSTSLVRLGALVTRPKVAAAVLLVAMLTIGLPVAYSSWARQPIPRQKILGEWVSSLPSTSETARPSVGVGFFEDGSCVLVNASGESWTGDFEWAERTDQGSKFRPLDQVTVRYDSAAPGHVEDTVVPSDGYLRLSGFVKEPPRLNGHPVRDLFVRRSGDLLKVGYLTQSHWVDGRHGLLAAWVELQRVPETSRSVEDILRDLPEELPTGNQSAENAKTICLAIDEAIRGREFEFKNQKAFRHGCFTFSQTVDAGYLLKHLGVPDVARPLREFEKQPSYNGPSMDGAQLFRYDFIDLFLSPEGELMFIEVDLDAV
ncbi:hypothetical protein [Neorhodopirellula pilleata]|uniref:GYF domain-containing protein n=1 Tax=Neorhodopirellula pilleata TaxID=2714738 RepID=A0A5C6AW28_9BACT|nr:hypothetical protein [Neorhodopirellula pilleata]TWU03818.1 hypothetical protein Pla100_07480 [Neorhodopirellula pilleata]